MSLTHEQRREMHFEKARQLVRSGEAFNFSEALSLLSRRRKFAKPKPIPDAPPSHAEHASHYWWED